MKHVRMPHGIDHNSSGKRRPAPLVTVDIRGVGAGGCSPSLRADVSAPARREVAA